MNDNLTRLYNIELSARVASLASCESLEDWRDLSINLLETTRNIANRDTASLTASHRVFGTQFWCISDLTSSASIEDEVHQLSRIVGVEEDVHSVFISITQNSVVDDNVNIYIVDKRDLLIADFIKFLFALVLERSTDEDGYNDLLDRSIAEGDDALEWLARSVAFSDEALMNGSNWEIVSLSS